MKLITAMFVVFFASWSAHSAGKSAHDRFETGRYGTAGCGLGSMVFGDTPGMVQIFAATLNNTGVQTFGITSGTSNCGEGILSAQVTEFIETNRLALEKDIARGDGETLASLNNVLGCQNPDFKQNIRSNYRKSFPEGGASSAQIEAAAYKACAI